MPSPRIIPVGSRPLEERGHIRGLLARAKEGLAKGWENFSLADTLMDSALGALVVGGVGLVAFMVADNVGLPHVEGHAKVVDRHFEPAHYVTDISTDSKGNWITTQRYVPDEFTLTLKMEDSQFLGGTDGLHVNKDTYTESLSKPEAVVSYYETRYSHKLVISDITSLGVTPYVVPHRAVDAGVASRLARRRAAGAAPGAAPGSSVTPGVGASGGF